MQSLVKRTLQRLPILCFSVVTLALGTVTNHADALDSVSEAYRDQGKRDFDRGEYRSAVNLFRKAADEAEKAAQENPDTHNDPLYLAGIYNNLGEACRKMADNLSGAASRHEYYLEAEDALKKALTIKEHQLGTYSLVLTRSLENLAAVYLDNDQLDEAEALYRKALFIREHKEGIGNEETASDYLRLGEILTHSHRGAYKEAEQSYRKALATYERNGNRSDMVIGTCHQKLALVLSEMNRLDAAATECDAALTVFKKHLPQSKSQLESCNKELLPLMQDLYYKAFQEYYSRHSSSTAGDPEKVARLRQIAIASRRLNKLEDASCADYYIKTNPQRSPQSPSRSSHKK